jgi:hypothetical protein
MNNYITGIETYLEYNGLELGRRRNDAEVVATNLLPNPSFEVDTTGWTIVGADTTSLTRVAAWHNPNEWAARATWTNTSGSGQNWKLDTGFISVDASTTYSFRVKGKIISHTWIGAAPGHVVQTTRYNNGVFVGWSTQEVITYDPVDGEFEFEWSDTIDPGVNQLVITLLRSDTSPGPVILARLLFVTSTSL